MFTHFSISMGTQNYVGIDFEPEQIGFPDLRGRKAQKVPMRPCLSTRGSAISKAKQKTLPLQF